MVDELEKDADKEQENTWINAWQKKKDPDAYNGMYKKYESSIYGFINKYQGGNVSKDLIHAEALSQLADALETYDASKGAGFHTHLHNRLQKLYRFVNQKQNVAYVPEHQTLHIASFINTKNNLTDTLGRTPSYAELAHAMKMDIHDILKLEKSLVSEINIGEKGDFDVFHSDLADPTQMYLYDAIPDEDKSLYEAIAGIGQEPTTNMTELSKRLGIPYNQIRKKVKNLSEVLNGMPISNI
jgi:DNA-directed RNA polymerase sigma subunit (sigma70/sigma32)